MLESPLMDILSQRLADAAQRVRGMRNNGSLSDFDFALAGICRVLSQAAGSQAAGSGLNIQH